MKGEGQRITEACLVLVFLLGSALCGSGDVITLKNGNVLNGRITSSTDKDVVVELPFGSIILSRHEIAAIKKEAAWEYHLGQGDLLFQLGDYEASAGEYRKALSSAPKKQLVREKIAAAHVARAEQLLSMLQSVESAREAYTEALGVHPGYGPAEEGMKDLTAREKRTEELLGEGRGLAAAGDFENAVGKIEEALTTAPWRSGEIQTELAGLYVKSGDNLFVAGDLEKAAIRYERAFVADPQSSKSGADKWAYIRLRSLHDAIGSAAQAGEQYVVLERKLESMLPNALAPRIVRYYLGVIAERGGRPSKAYAQYARAVGLRGTYDGNYAELRRLRAEIEATLQSDRVPLDALILEMLPPPPTKEGWLTTEEGDFVVYHHDERLAKRLLADISKQWRGIVRNVAKKDVGKLKAKCHIYVYDDPESFARATAQPAWLLATTSIRARDGEPVELRISTFANARGLISEVVPRELAKVVLAQLAGYPDELPLWLKEGVGMYQEGRELRKVLKSRADSALAANALIPLDDILQMRRFPSAEKADLFVAQAWMLVSFLKAAQDDEVFLGFAGEVGEVGFDEALEKHYGYSSRQAFKEALLKYGRKGEWGRPKFRSWI